MLNLCSVGFWFCSKGGTGGSGSVVDAGCAGQGGGSTGNTDSSSEDTGGGDEDTGGGAGQVVGVGQAGGSSVDRV